MKKVILFTFLFLSKLQLAQTWCPSGANWHYKDFYPHWTAYRMGITELKFTNTITINNTTCCQISKTFTGVIGDPNQSIITFTYSAPIYTYEGNHVYYVYNSDKNNFDTLCNFNANIGDKWLIPYTEACNSQPSLIVVDTGHIFINSHFLKKIVVNYKNSYFDTIIEKIGGFNHYFGSHYQCTADLPTVPDFICYQDNNFALFKKSNVYSCYYDVGIIEYKHQEFFTLFPNPANNQIIIQLGEKILIDNETNIKIINLLGQQMLTRKLTDIKTELDVSDLAQGAYVIQIKNKFTSYKSKLIISR